MKKSSIIILAIMILGTIALIFIPRNRELYANKDVNPKKKVGVILSSVSGSSKVDGMIRGLGQYGYSRDELEIIIKNSHGDREKIEILSRELIEEKVDIIITTGAFETRAIKEITDDIPVIFIGVGCSVELGYVKDNIATGSNITGVDSHYVQLSGKRLEFLKRIIPETKKVLILYNPIITPFGPSSEMFHEAARKLDIELEIVSVDTKEEIISELEKNKDSVDGVMLMCNFLLDSSIDSIVQVTLENKIPVMGLNDYQVEKGILGFYGSTSNNEGIQAARLVANVLKGQNTMNIPIEAPEKLEFHLNFNTAEALGIELEESNLVFIDKFIKE